MAKKLLHEDKEGWTLIYYQSNVNQTTQATIGFKCGSKKDGEHKGIAHLLEHMLFTANDKFNKDAIYEFFRYTDTKQNAFTTNDSIAVLFDCTNSNVNKIFEIFGQILLKKEFTQEELDRERKVVIHELNEYLDEENIANNTRVRTHSLIGNEQSLNNIQIEDLVEYSNKYFVKENLVMSVVSSLPIEEILPLLKENFIDKIPSNPNNKVITKPGTEIFATDLLQTQDIPNAKVLTINFMLKGKQSTEENDKFARLEKFIFNGDGGILQNTFRERNALTYTPVFESSNFGDKAKIFQIRTNPENMHYVIDQLCSILSNLINNGISDDDFFKFKTNVLAERERKANIKTRKATTLFENYIYGEDVFVSGFFEKLLSLTKEEINDYFKDVYGMSKLLVFIDGDLYKASNIPTPKEIQEISKPILDLPYVIPDEIVYKKLNEAIKERYNKIKFIPKIEEILSKYRLDYKIYFNNPAYNDSLILDREITNDIRNKLNKDWSKLRFKTKTKYVKTKDKTVKRNNDEINYEVETSIN